MKGIRFSAPKPSSWGSTGSWITSAGARFVTSTPITPSPEAGRSAFTRQLDTVPVTTPHAERGPGVSASTDARPLRSWRPARFRMGAPRGPARLETHKTGLRYSSSRSGGDGEDARSYSFARRRGFTRLGRLPNSPVPAGRRQGARTRRSRAPSRLANSARKPCANRRRRRIHLDHTERHRNTNLRVAQAWVEPKRARAASKLSSRRTTDTRVKFREACYRKSVLPVDRENAGKTVPVHGTRRACAVWESRRDAVIDALHVLGRSRMDNDESNARVKSPVQLVDMKLTHRYRSGSSRRRQQPLRREVLNYAVRTVRVDRYKPIRCGKKRR